MQSPSHDSAPGLPPGSPIGGVGASDSGLPLIGDFASAAGVAQMADALPWPMMVVQTDGCLHYANRAARALLAEARTLALQDGRHLLLTPARLQDALMQALEDAVVSGKRTLLQLPGPGSGYAATVTPLHPPAGLAPGTPRCVLLALAGDDSRRADTRAFAQLYQLSPAETRVLLHLANGHSSTRVAQALGVDASTVRSQILNLRRKTGHASVAELLRALNRMPPSGPDIETPPSGGE